jgi:cobalt/nickel transport system permease protein
MIPLPFAVHISDGVLANAWLLGGFVFAGFILVVASWKIDADEIATIGLMTAAFFVSSSIRVPIGPSYVHPLMTGLVGVVLGRRAPLAIAIGLFWQAVLMAHGGFLSMGVNACVIMLPALGAGLLFRIVAGDIRIENRRRIFIAGIACGFLGVFASSALNALALIFGGVEDIDLLAKALFLAHLPLAIVEGILTGTTAVYLTRVKPQMLTKRANHSESRASES